MAAGSLDYPKILLFDIDGTLIESGGAGGGALHQALQRAFGIQSPRPVALHGRTDRGILHDLLLSHGLAADKKNLERLKAHYFELLPHCLRERPGRVLPGVVELLARLAACRDVICGVLTGNMARSAQMKLDHFGLSHFFHFGIYGDLAIERNELAAPTRQCIDRLVIERSSAPRQRPVSDAGSLCHANVVVIGDTPMDVALARALNARCLAVCTGAFDRTQLQGATRIVPDLHDVDEIESFLLSPVQEKCR
ncbi:MAG: phosphoglycolate phosphatase [Pirellulaceae bacterium]|nr:MAG: phosphoglycolate phosphatase [Pirellulaceae bacterium]